MTKMESQQEERDKIETIIDRAFERACYKVVHRRILFGEETKYNPERFHVHDKEKENNAAGQEREDFLL